MLPLHEHGLTPELLLENMEIDDDGSEVGNMDRAMDSERYQGLVGSDEDVWEVEPPAAPVQKWKRGDGASGSGTSSVPSELAQVESDPK